MLARNDPAHLLEMALSALSADGDDRDAILNAIPAPVYTTDTEGNVTFWNQACIEFAGRVPQLGSDRWCVTWQLFTTGGEPLKHEDCPMADAIREQRPIRDAVAIAERPDGTRVAFKPYPTPLFDSAGNLTGAVNMLIDVTDEQSEALHEQAERCRRLANATYHRETSKLLGEMAEGYVRAAQDLQNTPSS